MKQLIRTHRLEVTGFGIFGKEKVPSKDEAFVEFNHHLLISKRMGLPPITTLRVGDKVDEVVYDETENGISVVYEVVKKYEEKDEMDVGERYMNEGM